MYTMHIQVVEMIGCTGVSAHLSDRDDLGRVHSVADMPVTFFEPLSDGQDPLIDMFAALVRFCSLSLQPVRVSYDGTKFEVQD